MTAELRVLSGARAGFAFRMTTGSAIIGRHLEADVRLDPLHDLTVSVQHALVARDDAGWHVRDLGSTNGTFLNGSRIASDAPLQHGDRIVLGRHGPEIEFLVHPDATGVTGRVRAAVALRTRRTHPANRPHRSDRPHLRRHLTVASSLALCTLIAAVWLTRIVMLDDLGRERAALQANVTRALADGRATARSLEGEVQGLTAALERSQALIESLSAQLARDDRDHAAGEVERLRNRLAAATAALERQTLAATLDFRAIERRNRPAVARIFVEATDGSVTTGTAFAVRPDATFVTTRHVLEGADGTRVAGRIGVQFSNSEQVWPARVLAVSSGLDLALVKVDNILGDVPTVRSLNQRPDTIPGGTPVAVIGYPLGGGDWLSGTGTTARVARPLVTAGVVLTSEPGRLSVQGYGAAGASGSPVLDGNGEVVAVLYGGRDDGAEHVLLAVPATAVSELLGSAR